MTKKGKKPEGKLKKFWGWFWGKSKRFKVAALAIIIALSWFGYKTFASNKAPTTQIQTATVEKGTIVSTVSASGTVVSANTFTINTSASGVVSKVYVKDGDEVKKGQKIAEIELDLDGEQQYASAYASYVSADNSVKSAENNLKSAAASLDKVYDDLQGHENDETFAQIETRTKAESSKDNAVYSLNNAKANFTNAVYNLRANSPTITAPNSGTIEGLTIAEGLPLNAQTTSSGTRTGQRIASIIKDGKPLISVNLSEIDVPKVEVGQKATITFDSITDKTFTGIVTAIDRAGSTTSNVTSYPAIITLDSGSDQILPNMAVTANIITKVKNDTLSVPVSAVKTQNGESTVIVIKNGNQETVSIEIGISSDSNIEVTSGLSQGDEVVTGTITTGASNSSQRSVFSSGFGGARFVGR